MLAATAGPSMAAAPPPVPNPYPQPPPYQHHPPPMPYAPPPPIQPMMPNPSIASAMPGLSYAPPPVPSAVSSYPAYRPPAPSSVPPPPHTPTQSSTPNLPDLEANHRVCAIYASLNSLTEDSMVMQNMLMQVLSLTPDQISALPPSERDAIQQLVRYR
jgi:cleavage stimulation factor subunit 2